MSEVKHTPALDEPVLPDDYPIHGGYLYVADGKVVQCEQFGGLTAAQFKRMVGAKELRRCDIVGRQFGTNT